MPNALRLLPMLLLLLAAPVCAAHAHAILVESAPAANAVVPPGHLDIKLRYNSRIDAARSRVALSNPSGPDTVLKLPPSGRPDLLTAGADLTAGQYVLHWQVLAVDGHITRGNVPFTVGTEAGN